MPPHGPLPSQPVFVAPKLWTMQFPKSLPTEEPFVPDVHLPNGTEPEDKLTAEMIEHGYRDAPVVCEDTSHKTSQYIILSHLYFTFASSKLVLALRNLVPLLACSN